jgi:hypothetical protein
MLMLERGEKQVYQMLRLFEKQKRVQSAKWLDPAGIVSENRREAKTRMKEKVRIRPAHFTA